MIATNPHKLKDVHGEIQETHGNDDGYDIKTLATYQNKQNTSNYVVNIS